MRTVKAKWRPTEWSARYRGCYLTVFCAQGKWFWEVANHRVHKGAGLGAAQVAMRAAERFVEISLATKKMERRA